MLASLLSLGRTTSCRYVEAGYDQKIVSGRSLSSVLGNLVHPCREVNNSNSRVLGNRTTWSCALTYYNYNHKLIKMNCGSGIASSQGVEEGSLGVLLN